MNKNTKDLKLRNYLALAGAVAASNSINSQIVYTDITDVTIDSTSAPFLIDFDNNAIPEITFAIQHVEGATTYMGLPITYNGAIAGCTPGSNVGLLGQLGSGSGSSSYSFQLAVLNDNDPISENQAFASSSYNVLGADITVNAGILGTIPYQFGPFLDATDKFLGASFVVNGNVHYGWVRLSISADATTITFKDYAYNACSKGTINAGQTEVTILPMTATSNLTCNNIDLTLQGGNGVISFDWSNDGTGDFDDNEDAILSTTGTYSVMFKDEQCQSDTLTFTVDASTAPQIALNSSSVLNVSCNGDGGSINIDFTLTGGASVPTFLWSNGQTTEDISNLAGGEYTVNLTDENGCSNQTTYLVSEPEAIQASYTSIDEVTGNDGSIDVTVSGGTSPYSYSWTPNLGATQDLANLPAGNYSVTITDFNGCSEVLNITISSFVGIDELSPELISVNPNPNNGYFTLKSNGLKINSIEIYSMNGAFIKSVEPSSNDSEIHLNAQKGIYLLRINSENNVITKRFILN